MEIKLLKARLEQTEKALERIVAHMGSVTNRLANNGILMTDQVTIATVQDNINNNKQNFSPRGDIIAQLLNQTTKKKTAGSQKLINIENINNGQ